MVGEVKFPVYFSTFTRSWQILAVKAGPLSEFICNGHPLLGIISCVRIFTPVCVFSLLATKISGQRDIMSTMTKRYCCFFPSLSICVKSICKWVNSVVGYSRCSCFNFFGFVGLFLMQVTHLRTKALTRLGSPAMKKSASRSSHVAYQPL